MKYELAGKANQDRKIYAQLKELNINDFIDSIIEAEKSTNGPLSIFIQKIKDFT